MWKLLLPLSLMMMGSGLISKRVENATIAAIIHQAKPFFTTDMQEIESLIRELEEKESRDSFEEVLLKEIKIYRYQLEDRLNLARRTSQADG
jgi:hypothetical protein